MTQLSSEPCSDSPCQSSYIVKPPSTIPDGTDATRAQPLRSELERDKYKAKIYAIDKGYGSTLYDCGEKSRKNPHGSGCHCKVCEHCIPLIARKNAGELIRVIHRIKVTHPQARYLTGSITMASWYGTLLERMTLLCDTLTSARKCAFWKNNVLGYEEVLHYSGIDDINGHVQPLYILKPDADIEAFKHSLHDYLQKRIGKRYVNYKNMWMTWMQPVASIDDTAGYLHSDMLKGGFVNRKFNDLKQIVPCIRATDQVRRGGIINETRKEQGMNKQQNQTSAQSLRLSIQIMEDRIHEFKAHDESEWFQTFIYSLEDQLEEMKGELDFQEWRRYKAHQENRAV